MITPTTLRFTDAQALTAFASGSGEGPQRPRLPDLLSDPTLTGMSRADLAALTERLSHRQTARTEGHRHRRRGGERLPGAPRRRVPAEITDAEPVLATVLYQRDLCSQETLADLFEVSRRTIGNVVREVAPLLAQHGYHPAPAPARFATATALIDS